jgi:glycosyltransferase involved in cell wall biosynthesis
LGFGVAFHSLRTENVQFGCGIERLEAVGEAAGKTDVIPILDEDECIIAATVQKAVQAVGGPSPFIHPIKDLLRTELCDDVHYFLRYRPIHVHAMGALVRGGVRNGYLGGRQRQDQKIRIGSGIHSGQNRKPVNAHSEVEISSPRIRNRYGGYNTYVRALEGLEGKVGSPVRILVTWTAYWARFAWLDPKPFWVTVHGKEIGLRSSWWFRWMQAHVYLRSLGVIAISDYTRTQLLKAYPQIASKVVVVRHGLADAALPTRKKHGTVIRILSIGQWIPRKGFDVLIEAVMRLSSEIDLRLDILTDSVTPNLPTGVIHVHRSVSDAEKLQFLADADLFVLANRHVGPDFEGFGYVVLEAMHAGLPCIVGQDGGPAELIRHGLDGLVVDAASVEALVDALRTLCLDSDLRQRMGASARGRASDEFSESAFQNRMLEVLGT